MDFKINRTRREMLKTILALGAGAPLLNFGCARKQRTQSGNAFLAGIGVCTEKENAGILKQSGCDYIEESVGSFLVPTEPEETFRANMAALAVTGLPVPVCRIFIPGSLKSVGDQADHEAVLAYAETAFQRAQISGVKTIVLGSGGSRKIPEGFDKSQALMQFISLLERMGPIAAKYNVVIALEHLNTGETNFINTLTESLDIALAVNHPNIRLLVDIYHMMREDEPPEVIFKAGKLVHHCHIAEKELRTAPGVKNDNFRPYFAALKKINYTGLLTMECGWDNLAEQLPKALAVLRRQLSEV